MKLRCTILSAGTLTLALLVHSGATAQEQPAQPAPTKSSAPASATERRLYLRFVEDGGVTSSFWLEGQVGMQTNSQGVDSSTRGAGEARIA